jgi:hypothetical protein
MNYILDGLSYAVGVALIEIIFNLFGQTGLLLVLIICSLSYFVLNRAGGS